MTGSEKQIAWAKKIIAALVETATSAKTLCESKAEKTKNQDIRDRYLEEVAGIEEALEWASKVTDSTRVIDCRSDIENLTPKSKNWSRIAANVAFMAGTRL